MTTSDLTLELPARRPGTADVEVVVPVHDEEVGLDASIRRLHAYLTERFPLSWIITIADNASTDRTWGVACQLATELDGVRAVHLDKKGRGRALRSTWTTSHAAVVTYMDVDLSTDLDALLPLVAPLLSGHSDVAIGTRLAPGARVTRGPKRELISRIYNLLLRATVRNGFTDAQCGFKAVRSDVARALVPLVEDDGWFFDTELLVLAEHNGMRIHEVPVDWVDDPDSRVDVRTTAIEDLRGIWRVVRSLARGGGTLPPGAVGPSATAVPALTGQLVRFAGIGAVSTVVFTVLYLLLAGPLGPVWADVVALAGCAVANLAANRRLTFAARGRSDRGRHYAAGLTLAALPLGLSLAALVVLGLAGVISTAAQLVALTSVNAFATLARFTLLRRWVFRDR